MRRIFHSLLLSILVYHLGLFPQSAKAQERSPKRELRGVWIATVANIDWPTVQGGNPEQQKNELIEILDNHQRSGLNAVFFQVRPAADSFYASAREPWSRFLTGTAGKEPTYDPLQFALEECHKRGLELHAWFNPYRASTTLNANHFTADHITKKHPEWFFTYAGKKLFNPGLPQVRQYIIDVIMDVVEHYDIDGVHFDDYFYPYPDSKNTPIPDAATYKNYPNAISNLADWRRDNVNQLIRDLGTAIKAKKPYVKYGISPFGIWDNKRDNPAGSETGGLSGYRTLYADGVKWMQEGWIDYINPQIYFPFQNRAAAFEILTAWWQQHTYGRHFYIGHGAYRVNENKPGWTDKGQIPKQVRYLRQEAHVQGSIYFSSQSLTKNLAGLRDSLRYDLYRNPALLPTMPWLDSIAPEAPFGLQVIPNTLQKANLIVWQQEDRAADNEPTYGYVIYRFVDDETVDITNSKNIIHVSFNNKILQYTDLAISAKHSYTYVVTALDRLKNESEPSNIRSIYVRDLP